MLDADFVVNVMLTMCGDDSHCNFLSSQHHHCTVLSFG